MSSVNTKIDQLISRDVLFGNPDKILVQLSPDGQYIAYVAPYKGVLNVWAAPKTNLPKAKLLTHDKSSGIRTYFWANDNKHIIYSQDMKGDENWRLYSVNVQSLKIKDLTPKEGIRASVIKKSQDKPNEILIKMNDRVSELFDVYRLDIDSGKLDVIYENKDGYVSFVADDQLQLRFGYKIIADGGGKVYIFENGDPRNASLYKTIKVEDHYTSYLSHITADGKYLYFVDSEGRDTASLFKIDIASKKAELIYEDKNADISDFITNPQTKIVEGAASNYFKKKWIIIDSKLQEDIDVLSKQEDSELEIISRTESDDLWIVVYLKDNAPYKYYLYERVTKTIKFLFTSNSVQEDQPFTRNYPESIKTRDGLEMVSYLSIPRWLDDGKGRCKEPIPMVLYVHGGPNARDKWEFNIVHQWLANRGYAVLSVNYRGSIGFGKSFTNKGDGEWFGKMHDDLEDSVAWAIQQRVTLKDKVAIMGSSYGGYAALVGLTKTPELFAAGIDIVGPSNLTTLLESLPPYWKPSIAALVKKIGASYESEEGREFLRKKSPLTYADKINKPLMIVQGANDPRVKQAESDQIVTKMKKHNIPVLYLLYSDEGHGLVRPENKSSCYAIAEEFLAKFIGGRFEKNDGVYERSSVQFIEQGYWSLHKKKYRESTTQFIK